MKTNNVLNSTGLHNRGINSPCVLFTHENEYDKSVLALLPSIDLAITYWSSLSKEFLARLNWSIVDIHCYLWISDIDNKKLF